MSHYLFVLTPSDKPVYELVHQSTKAASAPASSYPLAGTLPNWSASTFAGTLTALAGGPAPAQGQGHAQGGRPGRVTERHVVQMIAYASLDVIEDVMRREGAMYFKAVDKFNEWTISAFVTPGNTKFLLLHEAKNDDGIRQFFMELWELYVKTHLNPFHTAYTPIRSTVFDTRVRASAKKYL